MKSQLYRITHTQKRILVLFCVLLLVGVAAPATTQDDDRTEIALSIPFVDEALYTELAAQFEAANPRLRVRLVTNPFDFATEAPASVDEALDKVLAKVREADVLLVDESSVTVAATIAGYFLDMTPLIQIDPMLEPFDFYPAFWQSYQWDGGMWALPLAGQISLMFYDPAQFDQAGLFYPTPGWTLLDFEQAIRDLTEYDANDNVTRSAVFDFTENAAIYAIIVNLLGEGVYDFFAPRSTPYFDNPRLPELLTLWAEVTKDGLLGVNPAGFNEPIIIGPSFLTNIPAIARDLEVAPLPGGRANLTVEGFAISAGTRNPEAAYELARFLTLNRDLAQDTGDIPAQRDLAVEIGFSQYTPQVAAIVQEALERALPVAELRFAADLQTAIELMIAEGLDARAALERVEADLIADLQVAANRATTDEVVVLPPREIVLAPGEIALNFGFSSVLSPLPTQEQWNSLIENFVMFDPEVGYVNLDVRQEFFNVDLANIAEVYDCFYLPDNQVQGVDLSLLRNLDPLLANDFNFNRNDYVGNVFTQVQREDQTWALPLVLQPEVMFYNADLFALNGLPLPIGKWTVTEFEDALRNLKITAQDPAPFVPQNLGGTYIQVLLASYGGLALDYRTSPPTVQFTDPAVVQAAQQVLDLAKSGYIRYDGLTNLFGFASLFGGGLGRQEIAIYNRLLNPIGDFLPNNAARETDRLITFPQGAQLNAVSYDLGTVYISRNSQYAEACYRFISEVAANVPTLFKEMPARRSQIYDPALIDTQGRAAADFYSALDALMQQPTTVLIPTPLNALLESATTFLTTLWMNRAFDRYVFDDADLLDELQQAQRFADEFLDCAGALPPINPTSDDFDEIAERILNCATGVDPTFGSLIGQ